VSLEKVRAQVIQVINQSSPYPPPLRRALEPHPLHLQLETVRRWKEESVAAGDEESAAEWRAQEERLLRRLAAAGQPPPGEAVRGTEHFDKLTEGARRALSSAHQEAVRVHAGFVGTGHLLAGLLSEREELASQVLAGLGVRFWHVRARLGTPVEHREHSPGEPALTPRTRRVIQLAFEEAHKLGQGHIGTEHLLLGLAREGEGAAADILRSLGVTPRKLRREVLSFIQPEDRYP
jgi:hypothetical protein